MPDQNPQEVVIVGKDGTEHVFPPGTDPKRAASIVSGSGTAPSKSSSVFDDPALPLGLRVQRPDSGARFKASAMNLVDALPAIGGIAGSFVSPVVGTALGAAGGEGVKQIINAAAGGEAATTPAGVVGDMALEGAKGGATALAGAGIGKGLQAGGNVIRARAMPIVRSAIKPTVTAMKQQAGASMTGIDSQAKSIARSILRNRWSGPEQAEAAVKAAESEVKSALAVAPPTKAAQWANRNLRALEKSAKGQIFDKADPGAIAGKIDELRAGPLGMDVTKTVMQPPAWAPGVAPVPTQVTVRGLRPSVPAQEALDLARGTGKWTTNKAWGEMKGAELEAEKAAERGVRGAVKAASPEAKDALAKQAEALRAKTVLDRMAFREGNRDPIGLPGWMTIAADVSKGSVPWRGLAANALQRNWLKTGFAADTVGKTLGNVTLEDAIRAALVAKLGAGSATK